METTKNLSQDNQSRCRVVNHGSPEYKAEVLTSLPPQSSGRSGYSSSGKVIRSFLNAASTVVIV